MAVQVGPPLVLEPSRSPAGRVHVEAVDWEEGSFRGTFEGELMSRDGSETVRLTEGRFEVEGARPLEEVLPEGS